MWLEQKSQWKKMLKKSPSRDCPDYVGSLQTKIEDRWLAFPALIGYSICPCWKRSEWLNKCLSVYRFWANVMPSFQSKRSLGNFELFFLDVSSPNSWLTSKLEEINKQSDNLPCTTFHASMSHKIIHFWVKASVI